MKEEEQKDLSKEPLEVVYWRMSTTGLQDGNSNTDSSSS